MHRQPKAATSASFIAVLICVASCALVIAVSGCSNVRHESDAEYRARMAERERRVEAERQAAEVKRQEEARRLLESQSAIKQAVDQRIASGAVPPPRGADPGHPMMNCLGMLPVPFQISANSFPGLSEEVASSLRLNTGSTTVICANSIEGSRVLAYREWYCQGKQSACVLSAWSDQQPSLSKPPKFNLRFNLALSSPGSSDQATLKLALDRVYP